MKKYVIGKKIFLGMLAVLFGVALFGLSGQDVYASSVEDLFQNNQASKVVSGYEDLGDITVVDDLASISFSSVSDNPDYFYVKSDKQAYKLLYYTTITTIGDKLQNQTYPVYAPITATLEGKWQISDKGITYSYYDILKYMPSWEQDGYTYYQSSDNTIYMLKNGVTTESESDAYYKYKLDENDTNIYYAYQEVNDIELVYKYKNGSTVTFDNISPEEYNSIIESIQTINAKEYEYELMIEAPAVSYFYEPTKSRIDSEDWNSHPEYASAYYYGDNLYVYVTAEDDSRGPCYYRYSLKTLSALNYISSTEVSEIFDISKQEDNGAILIPENNELVVKVKDNYDLIAKTYDIINATKSEPEEVYFQETSYIYNNQTQSYDELTGKFYATEFDEISNIPTHFDTEFQYNFSYQSQTQYDLYKVLYEKVLYNYHHEWRDYKETKTTNYTVTKYKEEGNVYAFEKNGMILLSDLNGKNVQDVLSDVDKTYFSLDSVNTSILKTEAKEVSSYIFPTVYNSNLITYYYNANVTPESANAYNSSGEPFQYHYFNVNGTRYVVQSSDSFVTSNVYDYQTYNFNKDEYSGYYDYTGKTVPSDITSATFSSPSDTTTLRKIEPTSFKYNEDNYINNFSTTSNFNFKYIKDNGYYRWAVYNSNGYKLSISMDQIYIVTSGGTWYVGNTSYTASPSEYIKPFKASNAPSSQDYKQYVIRLNTNSLPTYNVSGTYKPYDNVQLYKYISKEKTMYLYNLTTSSFYEHSRYEYCGKNHYDSNGCGGGDDDEYNCKKDMYKFKSGTYSIGSSTRNIDTDNRGTDVSGDEFFYITCSVEYKKHGSGEYHSTECDDFKNTADSYVSSSISSYGVSSVKYYYNNETWSTDVSILDSGYMSPDGNYENCQLNTLSLSFNDKIKDTRVLHPNYNIKYVTTWNVSLSGPKNHSYYTTFNDATYSLTEKDGSYIAGNITTTQQSESKTYSFSNTPESINFVVDKGVQTIGNYKYTNTIAEEKPSTSKVYLTKEEYKNILKLSNENIFSGTYDEFKTKLLDELKEKYGSVSKFTLTENQAKINDYIISYTPSLKIDDNKAISLPTLYTTKTISYYNFASSSNSTIDEGDFTNHINVNNKGVSNINLDNDYGQISATNEVSKTVNEEPTKSRDEYSDPINSVVNGSVFTKKVIKTTKQGRYVFDGIQTDPNSQTYLIIAVEKDSEFSESNIHNNNYYTGYFQYKDAPITSSTALDLSLTADTALKDEHKKTYDNYYLAGDNGSDRFIYKEFVKLGSQSKQRETISAIMKYFKIKENPENNKLNYNIADCAYSYINNQDEINAKINSSNYVDLRLESIKCLNSTAFYSAKKYNISMEYKSNYATKTCGSIDKSLSGEIIGSKYGTYTNIAFNNDLILDEANSSYTQTKVEIITKTKNEFNQYEWFKNLDNKKVLKYYEDGYFVIKNLTANTISLFTNNEINKVFGYILKNNSPKININDNKHPSFDLYLTSGETIYIKDIFLVKKGSPADYVYTPYTELDFGTNYTRTYGYQTKLDLSTVYVQYSKFESADFAQKFSNLSPILISKITGYSNDDNIKVTSGLQYDKFDTLKQIISKYSSPQINVNNILYSLYDNNNNTYYINKLNSELEEYNNSNVQNLNVENSNYYYRLSTYREGINYIAEEKTDFLSSSSTISSKSFDLETEFENRTCNINDFAENNALKFTKIKNYLDENGYAYSFDKSTQSFKIYDIAPYRHYELYIEKNKDENGNKSFNGYTQKYTLDEYAKATNLADEIKASFKASEMPLLTVEQSIEEAVQNNKGKIKLIVDENGIASSIVFENGTTFESSTTSFLLSNKNALLNYSGLNEFNGDFKLVLNDTAQKFYIYDEYNMETTKQYLSFTKDYVFKEETDNGDGTKNIKYYFVYDDEYRKVLNSYNDAGVEYNIQELLGEKDSNGNLTGKFDTTKYNYIILYVDEYGNLYANEETNLYYDTKEEIWTSTYNNNCIALNIKYSNDSNYQNEIFSNINFKSGFELAETLDTYNLYRYINKINIYIDDYDNTKVLDMNTYSDTTTNLANEFFRIRCYNVPSIEKEEATSRVSTFDSTFYLKSSIDLDNSNLGFALKDNTNLVEYNQYIYRNGKVYQLQSLYRDGMKYDYTESVKRLKSQIKYLFKNLDSVDEESLYTIYYGEPTLQYYHKEGDAWHNFWQWFGSIFGRAQEEKLYYVEPFGTLNGTIDEFLSSYYFNGPSTFLYEGSYDWLGNETTSSEIKRSTLDAQKNRFIDEIHSLGTSGDVQEESNNNTYFDYLYDYCTKTTSKGYDAMKLLLLVNSFGLKTDSNVTTNNYVILNVGEEKWVYQEITTTKNVKVTIDSSRMESFINGLSGTDSLDLDAIKQYVKYLKSETDWEDWQSLRILNKNEIGGRGCYVDSLADAYDYMKKGELHFGSDVATYLTENKIIAYERINVNSYKVETSFFWIPYTTTEVKFYIIFYGLENIEGEYCLVPKLFVPDATYESGNTKFYTLYKINIKDNKDKICVSVEDLKNSTATFDYSLELLFNHAYCSWDLSHFYVLTRNYILSNLKNTTGDVYNYKSFDFGKQDIFFDAYVSQYPTYSKSNYTFYFFDDGEQFLIYDYIEKDIKLFKSQKTTNNSSTSNRKILYHEMPSTTKWYPISQHVVNDKLSTQIGFYVTEEDFEKIKIALNQKNVTNGHYWDLEDFVFTAHDYITSSYAPFIQKTECVNIKKTSGYYGLYTYTDFLHYHNYDPKPYMTLNDANEYYSYSTAENCLSLNYSYYAGYYFSDIDYMIDRLDNCLYLSHILSYSSNADSWKPFFSTASQYGYNKIKNKFTNNVNDYLSNSGSYLTNDNHYGSYDVYSRFNSKMNDIKYMNNPFKNQNIYSNISEKVLSKFYSFYNNDKVNKTTGGNNKDEISFDFDGIVVLPISSYKEDNYIYFKDGIPYLKKGYTLFASNGEDIQFKASDTITHNGITYYRCNDYQKAVGIYFESKEYGYNIAFLNYLSSRDIVNKSSLFNEYHYYTLNDSSLLDDSLSKINSLGFLTSNNVEYDITYPTTQQELEEDYFKLAFELYSQGKNTNEVCDYIKNQIFEDLKAKYSTSDGYAIIENAKEHKYEVYYGKNVNITNISSYLEYAEKYNLIQNITENDDKIKNLLYYNIENSSENNNLISQNLKIHINKECIIRLSYEIKWIGNLEDGTQVTIYNESDKEFIENKVKLEYPNSKVVHYPELNKSIVYIILNEVDDNNAPLVSNQYFGFELRDNKKLNYYSYAVKENYEINVPLINQSKYTLEVFNVFGTLLRTSSFTTLTYNAKNPYGTSLKDNLIAPTMLRKTYIPKTLVQLIYSNGEYKYGAENNGLVYNLPEQYCLQIEKTLGTASHLAIMFKDSDGNSKYLNGKMIIENFYGNNRNLEVTIKNGIASISLDDLRAYGWNFDGKFAQYQTSGTYNITDKEIQEFFAHEILSKYTISFNCNNIVTLENVNVFVDMAYSSNYSYLDLNQDGKCDSLIKWTMPDGTEITAISKYYDILGNEINAETKFAPNSYLGLYNVPKYISKIDDSIKAKSQRMSNSVFLYYNNGSNSTNYFRIIKIENEVVNNDIINAKLYYVSDNGTSVIVK